jgi:hypothetical protein
MRMETRPPGTHSGDGGFRSGGRTIVARLDRAKHAGKVGRNTRKGRAIYAGKVGRYTSSSDSERMCEPDEAAAHSTPFSYVDAQRLPDCFVSTLLAPGSWLLLRHSAVARCGRHRRSPLPCLLKKLFYTRNRSAAGKLGFELFQHGDSTIGLI